jgi:ribonuclease PH
LLVYGTGGSMSLREDGRMADELRPVTLTPNYTIYAEGSILISIGNTRVLCNATLEDGVPRWMQHENRVGGWITGEYAMLPRATQRRSSRETLGLRGRTQEIRRLIGRSLRAAIDLEKIGQRTCIVDCDVLQADGGTRTAAITGAYLAMALALKKSLLAGVITENPLRQQVAAISAGIVEEVPLLDLSYEEDRQADVDANIVMTDEGQFIEIQATAEGHTFSRPMLDSLLVLAYKGIGELLILQKKVLDDIT